MMDSPSRNGNATAGLITRALALKAATRFIREAGRALPIVLGSGRPFVLDAFSREWLVVFEEAADPYLALLTGMLQPRYRRVAVHAETGMCRWADDA